MFHPRFPFQLTKQRRPSSHFLAPVRVYNKPRICVLDFSLPLNRFSLGLGCQSSGFDGPPSCLHSQRRVSNLAAPHGPQPPHRPSNFPFPRLFYYYTWSNASSLQYLPSFSASGFFTQDFQSLALDLHGTRPLAMTQLSPNLRVRVCFAIILGQTRHICSVCLLCCHAEHRPEQNASRFSFRTLPLARVNLVFSLSRLSLAGNSATHFCHSFIADNNLRLTLGSETPTIGARTEIRITTLLRHPHEWRQRWNLQHGRGYLQHGLR